MKYPANDEPDPIAMLLALGTEPAGALYLNPPATAAAIRAMQLAAVRDLSASVPDDYLLLLHASDGVQINGAYFKSAEYLVPENLDAYHAGVVVLGNSGNNAWFIYDTRDSRFHVTNFGFPDERFKSFDTFNALLLEVLREQGVA